MVWAAKCTFHDLASALAELDRHYMNVRQEAAIRPSRIHLAFSKDTDEKCMPAWTAATHTELVAGGGRRQIQARRMSPN